LSSFGRLYALPAQAANGAIERRVAHRDAASAEPFEKRDRVLARGPEQIAKVGRRHALPLAPASANLAAPI
jgi:hypothetical protein